LYKESVKPDVWVEARYVWEVRAAGLSVSPIYSVGEFRFPRFVRERMDNDIRFVNANTRVLFFCILVYQ